MISDEKGWKRVENPISTSVSISFFGGNRIRLGKCEFGNGIGIYGCTETNQYDRKFNGDGRKPGTKAEIPHIFILT
jgi:hypothetical protein